MSGSRGYRNQVYDKNAKIWYTDGIPVTTLYLASLGNEVQRHHIIEHFSKYGKIEDVHIIKESTTSFGYVTFMKAESAATALFLQQHTIYGHTAQTTRVAIADTRHQKKSLKFTSQLNVNIDGCLVDTKCLLKVFSLKYLTVVDLCSIARTSIQLKEIANEIFAEKYEVVDLRYWVGTIDEVRRMIVTFGSLTTEIKLGGRRFHREKWTSLLDLVTRCCTTLKSLHLYDCFIPSPTTASLRPIFKNLRKLTLFDCTINGTNKKLFANCDSLIELKFKTSNRADTRIILESKFPKLERFHSVNSYHSFDLPMFISRHTNLKKVKLCCYSTLLPIIASSCRHVEDLQLEIQNQEGDKREYEKHLRSLLYLDSLRVLHIDFNGRDITKFVQELNHVKSLKCLQLKHVTGDSELLLALSKLKRLDVLRLFLWEGSHQNLNLLVELDQLVELTIFSREKIELDLVHLIKWLKDLKIFDLNVKSIEIDTKLYDRIVSVVAARPSKQTLYLKCRKTQELADFKCCCCRAVVKLGDVD